MMANVIRRYACAAGRVQGVGFRMFVRQQAVMNDITGWVMNMSAGTVTMELLGDDNAVEAAITVMRAGNYFICGDRLNVEEREPVDGERDFSIKY